jgi:hypothetical protein
MEHFKLKTLAERRLKSLECDSKLTAIAQTAIAQAAIAQTAIAQTAIAHSIPPIKCFFHARFLLISAENSFICEFCPSVLGNLRHSP